MTLEPVILPLKFTHAKSCVIIVTVLNQKINFMSKIKELIVAGVLPVIKEVGKIEMKQVLEGIKKHNEPSVYKNTLVSLHANFLLLREAAIQSKTNIDDGIIDLILEAVIENAEANELSLV